MNPWSPSKPESQRRKVNAESDKIPSSAHQFNVDFAKPYIAGKKVLDIGCWSGQFEQLAQKYTNKMVGLDPNKEAIALAKKMVPKASFKVGRAEKLPFPDKPFNTVVLLDVIEHLPESTEEKCLREINRVLDKKGYLIISTPNAHPVSILLDPAYFLIDHRHYSMDKLKRMVETAGFKVIAEYQSTGIVRLLTLNLEMVFKHLLKRKLSLPKFVEKKIKDELYKGGFAQNYLICQKLP